MILRYNNKTDTVLLPILFNQFYQMSHNIKKKHKL